MSVTLPQDYRPTRDEQFMSPLMLEYFKQKLIDWRTELLKESEEAIHHLQEENLQQPDITDRASLETDNSLELRRRDRQRKLISKIESALRRVDNGTYGYCEETGEPISVERLEARPVATLSIQAQEAHERHERSHSEEA